VAQIDENHEILVRLMVILPPGKRDLLTLIEAYFDESIDDGSTVLCVAGYLFRKEDCRDLDLKWKAVLDRFGLPFFRMSACAHGNWPFDKLCRDQRIEAETLMIKIIRSHMLFGSAVSVNEREYNSWSALQYIGNAYTYCCWQSLAGMRHWMEENKIDGDVAYFFESGHQHQSEANEVMKRIFSNSDLKRHYRYVTHAFVDKKRVRPVQTADILAWLHANRLKRIQEGNYTPRKDYVALVEGKPHRAFIADNRSVAPVIRFGNLLLGVEQDGSRVGGSWGPWQF
jgi:hypothetical protein